MNTPRRKDESPKWYHFANSSGIISSRQENTMESCARRLGLVVLAAGLFLQADAAVAQTKDDSLIGRWVLDRARSEFSGNVPEKRITIFQLQPDGNVKHITETVTANGSTDRVEYASKYDGKDLKISNSFLWTVAVKRIDARTTERTGKVNGEVVETSKRTVSADGQTLTITTTGTNNGNEYSSTQVFTRDKTGT
jgi:hypothetical protein